MEPLIEINGEEIKLCQIALGQAKFSDPRDSEAAVRLCSHFTDVLKNPKKHHAYAFPRIHNWLKKAFKL